MQSWFKDQLQERIANKGMAWPNYRRFSTMGGRHHQKYKDVK